MNINPFLALLDLKELLNPQWLGAINFGDVEQENNRTVKLCPLLWKTTIIAVHFAHANPWLFTISNLSWILCTFFSNTGQGLKLLIYHPKF